MISAVEKTMMLMEFVLDFQEVKGKKRFVLGFQEAKGSIALLRDLIYLGLFHLMKLLDLLMDSIPMMINVRLVQG